MRAFALLRCAIVNPSFEDAVRAVANNCEFRPESSEKYDLHRAAAATKVEGADGDFFLSGYIGENDFEALNTIAGGAAQQIHFPFVSIGWGSEEQAVAALAHMDAPQKASMMSVGGLNPLDIQQDYKKVLFKVTGGKSSDFASCRKVAHRLNGTIAAAGTAKDDVTHFAVAAVALEAQTVEAWKAAQAAAVAAQAGAGEGTDMGGMMDAPAEGMMDAPAEGMEGM